MTTTGYAADACVNWGQFTVPQLWEMVVGEGDPTTYQQVSAWQQAHDAIAVHASTLRTCRADLVAGWRPERSDAAAAFVTHIDKLLANLDIMAGVAATNSQALHGIANALAAAKEQLQPIHQEWQRKEQAAHNESTAGKTLDALTFWSDEDAWREELQNRAYRVMTSTDRQVAQHRDQMQVPPSYSTDSRWTLIDPSQPDAVGASTDTGSLTAPTRTHWVSAPTIQPPDVAAPGSTLNPDSPPLLAGVGRPDAPPPSTPAIPTAPRALPPANGFLDAIPGILGGGFAAGVAVSPRLRSLGRIIGTNSLINDPAELPARPTASSGPTRPSRLVGPGGVIGGQAAGQPSGAGGPTAAGAARRRKANEPGTPAHRDDVWMVADGGPAIIEPPNEPTYHDPGLNVFGLDR